MLFYCWASVRDIKPVLDERQTFTETEIFCMVYAIQEVLTGDPAAVSEPVYC